MVATREIEPRRTSLEEQALREVEGYVERMEKRAESVKKDPGVLKPVPATGQSPTVSDDQGNIVMQSAQQQSGKVKIVLPLNEEDVEKALHHKVFDAVRWLAEWCVFMIKKYPGRVFYKQ